MHVPAHILRVKVQHITPETLLTNYPLFHRMLRISRPNRHNGIVFSVIRVLQDDYQTHIPLIHELLPYYFGISLSALRIQAHHR